MQLLRQFLLMCAAGLLPVTAALADDPAPAPAPEMATVPAHWVKVEQSFTSLSTTTFYSCDSLRNKLRDILLQLGARKDDLKLVETGCIHASGPDRLAGARITMWVLQPLAPSETADDATVQAHWQNIEVKDSGRPFDGGDCDLLEQVKRDLVPVFATRDVKFTPTCMPHGGTFSRPRLSGEVLMPPSAPPTSGS